MTNDANPTPEEATPSASGGGGTSPPVAPQTGFGVATKVFWPAAILIVAFVIWGIVGQDSLGSAITWIQDNIVGGLGWYYVILVTSFVIFSLIVGISRLGDIKLGKDDEEPDFSVGSWLAMLFSAGMGIGLVFYGVAEPLWHFTSPKPGVEGTPEELAEQAMTQTLLHWGVHAWAIYVVVGLAIAYAVFRKGRPVSIRWALEPLLGDRVKGWLGDLIDVIAILGTLFGVATSLGIGATQISAGLGFLDVLQDPGDAVLVTIIIVITLFATISVVTGLKRGIKWLSNVNVSVAGLVALFILVMGPTLFILREFVQSIGAYLQNLPALSFDVTTFQPDGGIGWQSFWTIFYWGWWISWAPFVGMFIARISRGRTVRQFVIGVLAVPTIVTFAWFAILGGSALNREINGEGGMIVDGAPAPSDETALFQLLDGFSGGTVVSFLVVILIATFFITSSDSGSLVVDMLASGGDPNPPTWSRVFWALMEGAVAIVLLLAGSLGALQTGAISLALPFSIIMILMMIATWRALRDDHLQIVASEQRAHQEALAAHVHERVTDAFSESVSTVVSEHPPPTPPEQEREWNSWWQRVLDALKSRPGGGGLYG
ncbi:MAG: BCCT family transporter [Actinomycetota bacterium]